MIHCIWRKQCSPAPLSARLDRRPGERVGKGVILIETAAKPPDAQRAGGIIDDARGIAKLILNSSSRLALRECHLSHNRLDTSMAWSIVVAAATARDEADYNTFYSLRDTPPAHQWDASCMR